MNIRQLRLAAGLTQQQLAYRADCSMGYVQLLERGLTPAHSDVLPRILHALDADDGRSAVSSDEHPQSAAVTA